MIVVISLLKNDWDYDDTNTLCGSPITSTVSASGLSITNKSG